MGEVHSQHSESVMDYAEHVATYGNFVRSMKWGAIIASAVVALLAYFTL